MMAVYAIWDTDHPKHHFKDVAQKVKDHTSPFTKRNDLDATGRKLNIDEKLAAWMAEIPAPTDWAADADNRKKRHSALEEEISQVKASMLEKQSTVDYALACVKERVSDIYYDYTVYREQRQRKSEEKARLKNEEIEDWTFKYNIAVDNMEFKETLKYLQPKFRPVATHFEESIERVNNPKLKAQLKLLLNDYRRMYLHSKFLKDTDPHPKYLDDIKNWINDVSNEDAEQERDQEKLEQKPSTASIIEEDEVVIEDTEKEVVRLSTSEQMMEDMVDIIDEQSSLQSKVMEMHDSVISTTEQIKMKVLWEERLVQRMINEHKEEANPAILTYYKYDDLQFIFVDMHATILQEEDIQRELHDEFQTKQKELEDLEQKIVLADIMIKEVESNPHKTKERISKFTQEFSKCMATTTEPFYKAVMELSDHEKEQLNQIKEQKHSSTILTAKITKYQSQLAKDKNLKAFSIRDDFINSEMAKRCRSDELSLVFTSVVKALSSFGDAITPLHLRNIERLTEERKKTKSSSHPHGDSIKEAYTLFKNDNSEISLHTKPKMAFKLHEFILQEFNRLLNDSQSVSIESILEEDEKSRLGEELGNALGPLMTIKKSYNELDEKEKKKDDRRKTLAVGNERKKYSRAMPSPSISSKTLKPGKQTDAVRKISQSTTVSNELPKTDNPKKPSQPTTVSSDTPKTDRPADINSKNSQPTTVSSKASKPDRPTDIGDKTSQPTTVSSKPSKTGRTTKSSSIKAFKTRSSLSSSSTKSSKSLGKMSQSINNKSALDGKVSLKGQNTKTPLQKNSKYESQMEIPNIIEPEETTLEHSEDIAMSKPTESMQFLDLQSVKSQLLELSNSAVSNISISARSYSLLGSLISLSTSVSSENQTKQFNETIELYESEWNQENPAQNLRRFTKHLAREKGGFWSTMDTYFDKRQKSLANAKLSKVSVGESTTNRTKQTTSPYYEGQPKWVASGLQFVSFVNSRPIYRNRSGQFVDCDGNTIDSNHETRKRSGRFDERKLDICLPAIERPAVDIVKGQRFGPQYDPCAGIETFRNSWLPTAANPTEYGSQQQHSLKIITSSDLGEKDERSVSTKSDERSVSTMSEKSKNIKDTTGPNTKK